MSYWVAAMNSSETGESAAHYSGRFHRGNFMSIARDVTTVGSATLLSRLLGFARDVGIAAALGAGAFSDAFFAVLQIVNFFRRLLAEGALNAAFVPLWLRIKQVKGTRGAYRFLQEVSAVMLLAAGVLVACGLLFAPAVVGLLAPGFDGARQAAAASYLQIAAPYVALAAVVAVVAAVLNAEGRVLAVAIGVVAFNCVLLLALAWIVVFDVASPAAVGAMLAHAIVLAGMAQLLLTGAGFLRVRPALVRPRLGLSTDARRFFALAVPGLIATGIPQLKLIAGAMIASSSPAAVSWLYYANRLYELPLGVVSIATAAVLVPAIAASMRGRERGRIVGAQSRGYEIALGLTLPAAVGLALLAGSIASSLFEYGAFGPRDTAAVAAALAAIAAGLPGHALEKLFGAVAFAHEDTRTPMLAALAGLTVAVAGALALFPYWGHVGVAAAIGASGWVGALLLGALLWRRGWLGLDRDAMERLPRIAAATLVMGGALLGLDALRAHLIATGGSPLTRIAVLGILITTGLAVYLASLQLFGVARLRDLFAAVRSRV
jgi:putative peptidoglycan lipid II flippase